MAQEVGELEYNITGKTSGLGGAIKEAEKTIKGFGDKVKGVMESQSASVFKGILAYDAFKKSIKAVGDFIGDSIRQSAEASRIMAQVEQNVTNAGFSYEQLKPKINAVAESSIKLGFGGEQASESFSRLLIITKDYDQAVSLLNLSQDISRSKNIDLASATKLVSLVTQGQTRALKEYGIELDETASASDNLRKLQDVTANSAVKFADTTAGKLAILQVRWGDIKRTVGDELTPSLSNLLDVIENNMPAITAMVQNLASAFGNVLTVMSKFTNVDLIKQAKEVDEFSGSVFKLRDELKRVESGQSSLNKTTLETAIRYAGLKNFTNGLVIQNSTLEAQYGNLLTDAIARKFNPSVKDAVKIIEKNNEVINKNKTELENLKPAYDEINGSMTSVKTSFEGIGIASKASEQAIKDSEKTFESFQQNLLKSKENIDDLVEAIDKKLIDAFAKFNSVIGEEITTGLGSLAEIVVKAEGSIVELQKELDKELAEEGDKRNDERIKSLEDRIAKEQVILESASGFEFRLQNRLLEQENRLADLRARQEVETDPIKLAVLETEIQARQTAFDQISKLGNLDAQITEERRRASLDEFTRFEEDIFRKIDLRTEEFVSEVTQLREKKEIAQVIESDVTNFLRTETTTRQVIVDEFADKTILRLKEIGSEAKSAISALQSLQSLGSQVSGATSGGLAEGGFSQGGEMVHGGEYVMPAWLVRSFSGLVGNLEKIRSGNSSSKTVNAPVTVNARMGDGLDFRALARELSFEFQRL